MVCDNMTFITRWNVIVISTIPYSQLSSGRPPSFPSHSETKSPLRNRKVAPGLNLSGIFLVLDQTPICKEDVDTDE